MKLIGLFLGVEPHAGGMFQYAHSLLEALKTLPPTEYEIQVACASDSWLEILAGYHFSIQRLRGGKFGLRLADALMAMQLPPIVTRLITRSFNPISWQINKSKNTAWIFPAQDALGYQLDATPIVAIHDLMHRYEPHFPEVVKGRRYKIREHRFRNLVASAKGILVDSNVGRQHVVESYGADPETVHALPYVSPLHGRDLRSQDFATRYSLPNKFIFYPAQFWAHKNHKALIDAAAVARVKCPDMHLVFTGGKNHEFESVLEHVKATAMSSNVTFAGYVSEADLVGFYKHARAMIMPTFFGPTNIPPLEALLCECPIAVSNIYAMPEQLGNAAIYFDPRSISDIASVLTRLWVDDSLCQDLIANGRRKAAEWTPVQFASRLKAIVDQIASDSD